MTSRRVVVVMAIMIAGLMAIGVSVPARAQGGGADFTRFVGVGDALIATTYGRGCASVVGPANAAVGVRVQLVGAKMDAGDLGSAQSMSILADSGPVTLSGRQVVCVEADPVSLLGGQHVQTGLVLQVKGLGPRTQLTASLLSIDSATGRTLNTHTEQID